MRNRPDRCNQNRYAESCHPSGMTHQLIHCGLLYFLNANFVRGGNGSWFGLYRAGGADLLVTFANLAGRSDAGGFNCAAFRAGFSGSGF